MASIQRYVSTELTHFVGGQKRSHEEQYRLLLKILGDECLLSCPRIIGGPPVVRVRTGSSPGDNTMYDISKVCFCDIPLADLSLHMKKYGSFGLSFLKSFLVTKGASPVFYVAAGSAVGPTRPSKLSHELDSLIVAEDKTTYRAGYFGEFLGQELWEFLDKLKAAASPLPAEDKKRVLQLQSDLAYEFFGFLMFFDHERDESDEKNFYLEREWRVIGDVTFSLDDVWRVILPKAYAKQFRADVPDYHGQLSFAETG